MNTFHLVNVVDLVKTQWRYHYRAGSSRSRTYVDQLEKWGSWRRGLARLARQFRLEATYSFGFPHAITWTVLQGHVKAILRISKNGTVHMALSTTRRQFHVATLHELESCRDHLLHCLKVGMGEPQAVCIIKQVMANATLTFPPLTTWTEVQDQLEKVRDRREGVPVLFDPFRRLRIRGYDQWGSHPLELTMFLWFPESGRVIINGRCFDWVFRTAQQLCQNMT